MNELDVAQNFVDKLASALQILDQVSNRELYLIQTYAEYNTIFETVRKAVAEASGKEPTVLLDSIEYLLCQARSMNKSNQLSYAMAICIQMDLLITYTEVNDQIWCNGRLSLHSLIPIWNATETICIAQLNQNRLETGICVFPRFPVSVASFPQNGGFKDRRLASRDAMYGINNFLQNVGYYPWNEVVPEVTHIVLSDCHKPGEGDVPAFTRVMFSPLTDRKDLLELSNAVSCNFHGITYTAVGLSRTVDEAYIEKRFAENWTMACKWHPDIFFAPEMLATEKIVRELNKGSVFLKPLLKAVGVNCLVPPRLTVMPTYWKDGKNTAFIFDATGKLCGSQKKSTPLVNIRQGWVEAIDMDAKPEILLIHLKNQQRIAIAICAEYLANISQATEFLCGMLGATLILVPSYSSGEQDFLNNLPMLKPYGTSVIWGNCCGAGQEDESSHSRIVGGVSLAGVDGLLRMGSICKCGFHCSEGKCCLFQVDIPHSIRQIKPNSFDGTKLEHHFQPIQQNLLWK